MQLSKVLVSLWVLFCGANSFAYLILEQDAGPTVLLRHQGKIYYQPCHRAYVDAGLPRDVEKILKSCKAGRNADPYTVSENDYYTNISAFYGVPTGSFESERALSALTDAAVAAEGSFRQQPNPKASSGIAFDELFEKLSLAQDELLHYLESDADQTIRQDSPRNRRLFSTAIEAFTPVFSDGKVTLHISRSTLDKDNAACRADTGMASVSSIYALLAEPSTAARLWRWTAKQLKVDEAATIEVGTWQPSFSTKVTRDNRTGYVITGPKFQLELSEKTLQWAAQNRALITQADWKTEVSQMPGSGVVFSAAQMGGQSRNRFGQTVTEAAKAYPVFCMSRMQVLNAGVLPGKKGEKLGMKEIAEKYSVSVETLSRWAVVDPKVEQLLAPLYTYSTQISEADFERKLRPALDELFGVNLPDYEKLEQQAIIDEKERKAAELAEQKRQAAEAERQRLAAVQAERERRESERLQRESEVRYYANGARSAQADFDRAKNERGYTTIEFCAKSGYDISVWIAVDLSNSWGLTTFGHWVIPSFKCKTIYSGRTLGSVYYYATESGGEWSGSKDLVIQTSGQQVAVKAERSPVVPGEKVVGFKRYDGGSGYVWLNSNTAAKYGEMHRSGDQVYKGAAPTTYTLTPQYYTPKTNNTILLVPVQPQYYYGGGYILVR